MPSASSASPAASPSGTTSRRGSSRPTRTRPSSPGPIEVVLEQPVTGLVAAQETISLRSDSRPTLATIDVPVLVIVGELDVITPPADAETMVAGLADARLVVLLGAGHLTPIERPREVGAAVLDFLREVVP